MAAPPVAVSLYARRANRASPLGLGVKRIKITFGHRPFAPSEFYRDIVEPARRKAAIEMAHPRNDHARDRNADVGPRLVEHEEIETGAPGRARVE